jgi:EmrB/QacA subfamily drug resistance transporter
MDESSAAIVGKNYKWTALSNTTLGSFMAALDGSIVIISLPAIYRGINLDPLQPSNVNYLLWMLMGYLVCTAVLVVSFGRLGDMFGRVTMYNAGFALFTIASIALSLTPGHGTSAAIYLILMRVFQGIGGSLLLANSTAILTDAFPAEQRGLAMGINMVAVIAGSFIGLIVGGLLADYNWRLIFWVNVPFGIFGTIWAYMKLKELGLKKKTSLDWWGNITFAAGLVSILVAITYGIQPYGNHTMGWTSPNVIAEIIGGLILLIAFVIIERKVKNPMFHLSLFNIRPFTAGNLSSLFSAIGRGGLQFMLIIWLQGIWLPLHGYSFEKTPFWAGIYMLPMTAGFLIAGPVSGYLSDRFGAKYFATGGMILGAISFWLLMTLPANFSFWLFASFLFLGGLGSGLFAAPNSTAIMNSVPAEQRGQASGMRATFMNSGQVLSIGLFFSLMIVGLSTTLPKAMAAALTAQHIPQIIAQKIASAPPVASLFAAFLGYNPMAKLIPAQILSALPAKNAGYITGKTFFPNLISGPFIHGLHIAFALALVLYLLAAAASWMRGEKYIHSDKDAVCIDDEIESVEGVVLK